jgi:(4-O-methyl)-D-glucuronate---lignin esterase
VPADPASWYTEPVRNRLNRPSLIVFSAGFAGLAFAQPQAPRVPVPPIRTSLGSMPGVGELPSRPALPDVLTFENGDRVKSPAQWPKRREEMKRALAYYATGLMPPAPGNVQGREIRSAAVLAGAVHYRLVRLSFGPELKHGFDVALFVPAAARGPVPIVIFPTFGPTPGGTPLPTMARPPEQGKGIDALTVPLGDQAARAAAGAAAAKPGAPSAPPPGLAALSDPETAAAAHAELFRRGYALATYHYQDTGEDTIGRTTDGSWAFRTTRYYPAYPGYDWGLAAGWAWGVSRCIDYLEQEAFADRGKFIAIGHSRLGKAVLVAGAFDERIAVVAPAGSGAGGTGAYRFNGARGGGREGLADMMRKYPNWFSPNLYQFAADVDRLPFDQHWLIALAAPRAFVSLEGTDDQNCVPNALRQAIAGAMPAYGLLGVPQRLGIHYAPHRHALAAEDWDALLDFADQQLFGRPVARRFDQYPETAK